MLINSKAIPATHRHGNRRNPDPAIAAIRPSSRLSGVAADHLAERLAEAAPSEEPADSQAGPGDTIFAVETDRGILLTPYDPTFERAMELYARGAGKYRNALRELAK